MASLESKWQHYSFTVLPLCLHILQTCVDTMVPFPYAHWKSWWSKWSFVLWKDLIQWNDARLRDGGHRLKSMKCVWPRSTIPTTNLWLSCRFEVGEAATVWALTNKSHIYIHIVDYRNFSVRVGVGKLQQSQSCKLLFKINFFLKIAWFCSIKTIDAWPNKYICTCILYVSKCVINYKVMFSYFYKSD